MNVMNPEAELDRSASPESTGAESTAAESTGAESTGAESTAAESTGAEPEGAAPAAEEPGQEESAGEESAGTSGGRSRAQLIVRFVLGAIALLTVVVLVVRTLRPELEGVGKWFVARFGLAGVIAGTFIADGFHFPVPPQFYMLLAIAAQTDPTAVLAASSLGSVLGGGTGYLVARRLGHTRVLSRWLARVSGGAGDRLRRRYPYRSAVLGSVSPMAFSVLCYLAGLFRVGRGPLFVLLVLRLPKIALYYYLVRIGWSLS